MITAGEDRKLRYWDLENIGASIVFSGGDEETDKARYATINGRPIEHLELVSDGHHKTPHRVTLIAHHQQQLLRSHRDAVTALALIDLPFKCLISGDRSGSIKVFT